MFEHLLHPWDDPSAVAALIVIQDEEVQGGERHGLPPQTQASRSYPECPAIAREA